MLPAPVGPERLPHDGEDVRLKRIGGAPIQLDETGGALRDEIRARKDAALGDQAKVAPVLEWDAKILPVPGEHESTESQLRRAAKSMGHTRREGFTRAMTDTGFVDDTTARATLEALEASPPLKMQVISDHGTAVPPLDDQQPVTEELSFKNMREAQRAVKNFRDAQDRYQEALAQELVKTEENKQWVSQLEEQARNQPQQAAAPAPQPQPAADPLAAQKAHLAQLQQNLYWQQLSEGERDALHEMKQIEQWVAQAKGDERAQALGYAEQRYDELRSYAHQAAQLRTASQVTAANARTQQLQEWGRRQDEQASAAIKADMPEYASDDAWKRLQKATNRALKESTGLSDEQIGAEWSKGRWRSVPEQKMLARLGREQLLREGAKNMASKRAPVPPVQVPGVARPAGADAHASIAGLEQQLSAAPNQNIALKIAMRLTQAKRAAGLL
jgi:hypothetical protein